MKLSEEPIVRGTVGVISLLLALISGLLVMYTHTLGMPGGRITDFERAMHPINRFLVLSTLAFALANIWVALRVPEILFTRIWWAALTALILAFATSFTYEEYLMTFLDYGQGG